MIRFEENFTMHIFIQGSLFGGYSGLYKWLSVFDEKHELCHCHWDNLCDFIPHFAPREEEQRK